MALQKLARYEVGSIPKTIALGYSSGDVFLCAELSPAVKLFSEDGRGIITDAGLYPGMADALQQLSQKKEASEKKTDGTPMNAYQFLQHAAGNGADIFYAAGDVHIRASDHRTVKHPEKNKKIGFVNCCEKGSYSSSTQTSVEGVKKEVNLTIPTPFVVSAMYNSGLFINDIPVTDVALFGGENEENEQNSVICADNEKFRHVFGFINKEMEWTNFLSRYDFATKTYQPKPDDDPRYDIGRFINERNQRLRQNGTKSMVERMELFPRTEELPGHALLYVSGDRYPVMLPDALFLTEILGVGERYIDDALLLKPKE